jgi:predicted HTH transcriptional regulator
MSATDKAKKELTKALSLARDEVKAAQGEVSKIEKALASLGGSVVRRGRPSSTKKGRPKKKGGRRDQALKVIKANPGISSGEIAKKMKVAPAQVSGLISSLVKDGLIKKDGRKISAV